MIYTSMSGWSSIHVPTPMAKHIMAASVAPSPGSKGLILMNEDGFEMKIPTHLHVYTASGGVGVTQRYLTASCSTTTEQWDYELWPL